MRALGVVELKPLPDHPFRHKAVRHLMQIDRLVFQAAPQPLNEDIVQVAAPAIHGDRHTRLLQRAGEGQGGELTALIGIEYLRFAMVFQRVVSG